MRRSKLLKASRFGDFLRSTMSWWRSAMISASREARDLKSPMTTHKISLSKSLMRRSIARFAALRQRDKVYDKDRTFPFRPRIGIRLGPVRAHARTRFAGLLEWVR